MPALTVDFVLVVLMFAADDGDSPRASEKA